MSHLQSSSSVDNQMTSLEVVMKTCHFEKVDTHLPVLKASVCLVSSTHESATCYRPGRLFTFPKLHIVKWQRTNMAQNIHNPSIHVPGAASEFPTFPRTVKSPEMACVCKFLQVFTNLILHPKPTPVLRFGIEYCFTPHETIAR